MPLTSMGKNGKTSLGSGQVRARAQKSKHMTLAKSAAMGPLLIF